jgi:hypothetical protein
MQSGELAAALGRCRLRALLDRGSDLRQLDKAEYARSRFVGKAVTQQERSAQRDDWCPTNPLTPAPSLRGTELRQSRYQGWLAVVQNRSDA